MQNIRFINQTPTIQYYNVNRIWGLNKTNRATTRTLCEISVSISLSEVEADLLDKPDPRLEERDDLADVEAFASLSKKCKHSVILSHNFIAFYDANQCQIFAAFIQFPPPSEVNKCLGVNWTIFVGRLSFASVWEFHLFHSKKSNHVVLINTAYSCSCEESLLHKKW